MQYKGILAIVIILYLIFSIKNSIKILKSNTIHKNQRIINLILTWLIPFFWTIKVNKIIKAKKIEIITKENRNIKTGDFNDNCEGSAVLADLNGPH